MIVLVDDTSQPPGAAGRTVGVATGFVIGEGGEQTGVRVTFGLEWRPLRGLAELILDSGEPVLAQVETWQILSMETI